MCGIAGIISLNTSAVNPSTLTVMANCLAHRGPDGEAQWIDAKGFAGFSHRRLAVIDTSQAAAQPMTYANRYTIVYNGEIYNYIELREKLIVKGHTFRTASDTEVILAAYAEYGEQCLDLFDGMFAFALWDQEEQILFCARDRFGEKPFYYVLSNETFVFASEIKSLLAGGADTGIENGMLLNFLGTGSTEDPSDLSRTFYKVIKQLPASHNLLYDVKNSSVRIKKYWDITLATKHISVEAATGQLSELLTLSIKRRLRSDVPVGTTLSGGLDSSSIAATLAGLGKASLKTFTASFPEFAKDETIKAKKVADSMHYCNFTVAPTVNGLLADIEKLVYYHDEPVASASVYAQFKVFELAAMNDITVLLDGQGADEVLGGYDKYKNWRKRSVFPRLTAYLLKEKAKITLTYLNLDRGFLRSALGELPIQKPVVRELNDLLHFDIFMGGLGPLLKFADRNSMAHGREVRLPFLYHDLVSFIFSLPASLKVRSGYTKWLLRRLMQDKLPREIVWSRRKTGFEPPQKDWMRDPGFEELLMESKKLLVKKGILNKIVLDQRSHAHEEFDGRSRGWRWMATATFLNKKGV